MSASGLTETNWIGTWHGVIETYPEGQPGDGWHKTLVIGSYPTDDHTCTTWNGSFTQHGVTQLLKDYRFCRGNNATDLYIDVGDGTTLGVQRIDPIFITAFKSSGLYVISSLRMRGDTLEEEIITADDKPADGKNLVSMGVHSIHHIQMKRITD